MDTEAQTLLEDLRDSKVPKVLTSDNITKYSLEWQPKGIDRENKEHAKYLDTLVNDFVHKTIGLIEATDARKDQEKVDKNLFGEVLHHLQFTCVKSKNFHGCENLLADAHSKILKIYNIASAESQGRDVMNKLQILGVNVPEEDLHQKESELNSG